MGKIAKIRNILSKTVDAFITSILIHYYKAALKTLQLNHVPYYPNRALCFQIVFLLLVSKVEWDVDSPLYCGTKSEFGFERQTLSLLIVTAGSGDPEPLVMLQ